MIYLLLAICSSVLIAVVMRLSTTKTKADLSVLAANYVVCTILAAIYTGFDLLPIFTPGFSRAVCFGVIDGILFLGGFVLLQSNTKKHGAVLSQLFMRLGLLVPIIASIFLFKEMPTILQVVGFCLALGAILLMNLNVGAKNKSSGLKIGLILLLFVGGCGDVMAKVFEFYGNATLGNQFLFYLFATAMVLCIILVICKKERPGKQDLLFGAIIGVPNFFSAKFLLGAVMELPAIIVYPTYSVAAVLVVTLIGLLAFKERLRNLQWVALVAILVALIFLNV